MDDRMTDSPDKTIKRARKPRKAPGEERQEARERPRVGAARAISDLMPDIGRAAFRKFGFIQSSVVTRWAEIVGQRHAALTAPDHIRFPAGKRSGGTLQLVVASGHAPMIQHILPEIIERVNRFFGYEAVVRITLKQGMVRKAEPVDRPPPAMLRPVPQDLGEGLREVSDPELRAVLESLARGLANGGDPPQRIR
jgi:hypothetical protein